jgi:2-amino-4-hydroxy-6-hydroxymethyldihydropteridine diphosphokinase
MAEFPDTARNDHFRYAVGVGSNRGDRQGTIREAARALTADGSCAILRQAALVSTPAVGGPAGQGDYLNGAWLVATSLGPHQLLVRLQGIESALGRVRTVRWGARTIDLDLLLRDDGLVVASPALSLPHPRLMERAFVLIPLAEVVPTWTLTRPSSLGGDAGAAVADSPHGVPAQRITIRELAGLVASQKRACP